MSESLGEALLYLRTDDRGLEAGIAAAKGKSEGLGRTFDDTSGKAGSLGKAMDLAGGSATRLAMQQGQLTTVAKVQGAGLQQLSGRIGEVGAAYARSEEHTSELQSLMRTSYAVFCLKKKKHETHIIHTDRSRNL